jgi:hypothetical protein
MLSGTHSQRVIDLASQKGLLRASDLDRQQLREMA